VDLRLHEITISGDQAEARGRRFELLKSGDRSEPREAAFVCTLKRTSDRWVIQQMR
jgi:hypothetical protein